MHTQYVKYKNTVATICKNGIGFVDYPNILKVMNYFKNNQLVTSRELSSDIRRYRVYYRKNQLGKIFNDIDAIL